MKKLEIYLDNVANDALKEENISLYPGLFYGKMGVVVFLFLYAFYKANEAYKEFAYELMGRINMQLHKKSPVNYPYGLSGIGAGLGYLIQNRYIEADSDEIFTDFDFPIIQMLKMNETLASSRQIWGMGLYLSYRLKSLYIKPELKAAVSQVVSLTEMQLLRDKKIDFKTLNLLHKLSKVSGDAAKIFKNEIESQLNNMVDNVLLNRDYLFTKAEMSFPGEKTDISADLISNYSVQ